MKEVGVVPELFRSLAHIEHKSYSCLRSREQCNDPPDCEAIDSEGLTIGIEVTELVDQSAVEKCNSKRIYKSAEWNRDKMLDHLVGRIRAKDKPAQVKVGPYHAYWLVIHCDEPELSPDRVKEFLTEIPVESTNLIHEAFLLTSYVPGEACYPYFRIPVAKGAWPCAPAQKR